MIKTIILIKLRTKLIINNKKHLILINVYQDLFIIGELIRKFGFNILNSKLFNRK